MNDKNSKACTCAACLRVLAGQVKFCPFCGVAQSQAASAGSTPEKPADVPVAPPPPVPKKPEPAPAPAAPAIDTAPAAKQETAAKKAAEKKAAEQKAAEQKAAEQKATEQKAAEQKAAEQKAAEEKAKGKKPPATGDTTGGPPPKRMGFLAKLFLLGVALLVVFWIKGTMLNHDTERAAQEGLERQATAAMTLAEACKLDEARAALQALDEAKGTPQQHATVQKAISDAAPGCKKQLRHDAAWADAKVAVERALGNKNFDRANNTMKNFTAKWGEDDASRAMRDTIIVQNVNALLDEAETCLKSGNLDCTTKNLAQAQALDQGDAKPRIAGIQTELAAARERETASVPPGADVPVAVPQPARPVPQVRATPLPAPSATVPMIPVTPAASAPDPRLASLVNDAAKRMREGNYRGAEDLMSMCVSLDPNNRRCQELRQRASQMNRAMLACVASGKDWTNERCE